MPKSFTDTLGVASDIFIHEESVEYCRDSVNVTYVGADTGDRKLPSGYPIKANGVPALNATLSDTVGILIEPCITRHGETTKAAILARGPAVINKNALPTADYAGTSITLATLVTALTALKIVSRAEPTIQAEQLT